MISISIGVQRHDGMSSVTKRTKEDHEKIISVVQKRTKT